VQDTSQKHLYSSILWFLFLAFGLGVLVAGCGFRPTRTGASSSTGQGTLQGTVKASPTCPVERPDGRCGAKPVPHQQVEVKTLGGNAVATTTTDQQGQFRLLLPQGHYQVSVSPLRSSRRDVGSNTSVTITPGQISTVTIVLDTGIR